MISVHYDPMLAKLITWGNTRDAALDRMAAALKAFTILGLRHNIPFLHALVTRPEVADAKMHTGFIESALANLTAPPSAALTEIAAAMAAFVAAQAAPATAASPETATRFDPWQTLGRVEW